MKTYRVIVAPIDETDLAETLELTDAEATVYAGDEALYIRTNYDAMGGWQDERVIPWRRILDYRATSSGPEDGGVRGCGWRDVHPPHSFEIVGRVYRCPGSVTDR